MKKYLFIGLLLPLGILLASWGAIGHQTIARVAENHLTPEAKQAVKDLLGDETLPGIASWADQVRSEPKYKSTGSYHFVNLPSGLSYNDFSNGVKSLKNDNLYSALLRYEKILSDPSRSTEERAEALKFVVHLVGDAHQPMHVSRAEDKGGNTIQVQFDGRGTNLHALWDSRLIDHQGLSSSQIAKAWDNATPVQIKEWQAAPVTKWLYESYQISTELYAEVEKENRLTEDYYTKHIPEIQLRIEQGGIRLAGVLNEIFKNYKPSGKSAPEKTTVAENTQTAIPLKQTADVTKYIGQSVSFTDVVSDYKVISDRLTLLNIGGRYPNQILTIAIKGNAVKLNPADLKGKRVYISGVPRMFKGKPEIEVTDSSGIRLERK